MRSSNHLEKYRVTHHPTQPQFNTTAADGMNGVFNIPYPEDHKIDFVVIVSDGSDENAKVEWEHVSVRARSMGSNRKWYERVPNWREMCHIKDLFWNPDEVVVQFHPRKEDYVNIHPNVLHLWRWTGGEMPTPPIACV